MEFRSFPATTLLGDLTVISNFRRKNHFKRFDSLKAALAKLKTADPILDGEIVCLDGEGRSPTTGHKLFFKAPSFCGCTLLTSSFRNRAEIAQVRLAR
jgi:hypothetical protein